MNSIFPDQTVASLASSEMQEDRQEQPKTGNFLYQAATILAILLFLMSI